MKTIYLFIILALGVQMSTKAQVLDGTDSLALLNVVVTRDDGKLFVDQKVSFSGLNSKKEFSGVTDEEGNFSILIPEGDKYRVIYEYFGTKLDYTEIDIPSTDGIITFDFNIILEPPKSINLAIFFDTGKSKLISTSNESLDKLVTALKSREGVKIEIGGHTDNVGDEASNLKLSQARAESVKQYLFNHQISENRIIAKGYGPTMPIADNSTVEGRKKNRRTVVTILD